jgi:hypothetical protein
MTDNKKVVKAEVQIDVTGLDDATVKQITDALGHEQQSKIVKSVLANRTREGFAP